MTNISRIFSNVALVSIVAILVTGCALLPARKEKIENQIMVDDDSFTEISEDDSLDTIDAELDATVIEDEDFSELEAAF